MPEGTRRCPHCAEEILADAKVCKHCGRDIKAKTSPVAWGCLTLMALAGGCFVISFGLSPTDRPTPASSKSAPSAPRNVTPPEPGPQWRKQRSTSPVDDSPTVVLLVDANNEISGWPSKTVRPSLILRCQQNKTEMYVRTGMAPNVESGNLDGATVTIRFDDDGARKHNTSKSTDNEALFFRRAIPLIREMMGHERMLFQFTPYNSSPQVATFNVNGLADQIGDLREACHW